MTHKSIIEKYNCTNKTELRKIYRNNEEENAIQFSDRVLK